MIERKKRCEWVGQEEIYIRYHDIEWGVPVHDDIRFFESLILDGAQAGLSWLTILKRRDNYRRAFDGFDPAVVAGYTPEKVNELLLDKGIIRNRLKVESAVRNARAFLAVQKEYGRFDNYIWRFVDGNPLINKWRKMAELPATSPQSEAMSTDLKKRGFSFVGPTICYAFMQAVGMVNDHTTDCFRYAELIG
jgi:DNA-3-methyladenine glycosylase I